MWFLFLLANSINLIDLIIKDRILPNCRLRSVHLRQQNRSSCLHPLIHSWICRSPLRAIPIRTQLLCPFISLRTTWLFFIFRIMNKSFWRTHQILVLVINCQHIFILINLMITHLCSLIVLLVSTLKIKILLTL